MKVDALIMDPKDNVVTWHAVNIVMIYQTSCIDLSCSLSDQLSIFDNFLSFLQICQ